LLKALIVLGGHKVSVERLCDLLWPEAEGDHAYQNLKVTISRLRHICAKTGAGDLPWIVTHQKHVSLVSALCHVDAIAFREGLATTRDGAMLARTLDLYRGDFLLSDDSPEWIVAHRERLRDMYLNGVWDLARLCLENPSSWPAERHLEQAITLAAADPKNYELLIRVQLGRGELEAARETCKRLQRLLQTGKVDKSPALRALLEELPAVGRK
jgi:DNA-binding SARP family transcriptional activator